MAPQKRPRNDEAEEEIVAVESASSSLRQDSQRKRARVSAVSTKGKSQSRRGNGTPDSSSGEDDDEEEEEEDIGLESDQEEGSMVPPATQHDYMRDNDFRHLANEAEDDRLMTQRFLSRRQLIGDNHAANNSIIEEIICINFMCHAKLHVVLGPLINFIVGMNGSGKSAVLTAITLCLGGKSSSSGRGTLKNLVKTGCDQSILIIKLKNQGTDAYQHEIYGDSIIVERHFTRTGTGGYKVKSASGRIISTKKTDMDDIVEYFQLQVDNPMNVLTQDLAKSFITKSTPRAKYDFFVKGVQLEALDRDYKLVSETCDTIESKLDDSAKDIQELHKQASEAERRAKAASQHEGYKRQFKILQHTHAWGQVAEQETILAERDNLLATKQAETERQEQLVLDKSAAFDHADSYVERIKEVEKTIEEEMEPLQQAVETAKIAFDTSRNELAKVRGNQNSIKQRIKEDQDKVIAIKKDIETELQRIEDINGGSHARKLAEIEEAEQAVRGAKAAFLENQNEVPRIEDRGRALEAELRKVEGSIQAKRQDVENAHARLEELTRNRGNPLKNFDNRMPDLVRNIERDGGFLEKPVGPIGLHVKLLDPVWSTVIEKSVGRNLSGFAVTSKADQVRLSGIMQRTGLHVPILIGQSNRIDTSRNEPDPRHPTMMRVLEIDNDLVRNQLIINHQIEQSVLIKELDEAEAVMYSNPPPRNVKQGFALNPQRPRDAHRLATGGQSGRGRDLAPVLEYKGRPRLQSDINDQIQYQQGVVSGLKRELSELENSKRQAQTAVMKNRQELQRHRRDGGNLKLDSQRADDRVDALRTELNNENIEDGRLDMLREELLEAEQAVTIDQEAYGNIGLEKEKLNTLSTEKKRELDAVKLSVEEHDSKLRKAKMKVKSCEQARGIALNEKNTAIHNKEELKAELAACTRARQKQAEHVAAFIMGATEVCENRIHLEPGQTLQKIDRQLGKMKATIEGYDRQAGGTQEELNDRASLAKIRFNEAKKHHLELTELLGLLKLSYQKRLEMYRRFQRFISSRSRINFSYLLSERAFRGKLTIDHKRKKLEVHVEPDETTKSSKGRQTKTLSGGEKSFSNICLLLSLWEAMGAPLRCLDEFDVFMDDVNRDVSSKMIISAARKSVGRQFLLITPKGLGEGVDPGPDVKMIKLLDPRQKGQQRIDEMINENE